MAALDTIAPLMTRTVFGWQLRQGIESFAHHACAALGLQPVTITWASWVQTAAISGKGQMMLPDLMDDERVPPARIARMAGYVVHELLHRKWTNFRVNDPRAYVQQLHNALEDAWIERRAIREGLLGNIRPLLHSLIRDMVTEANAQVTDWTDPRQYPFSLAVYARGYGVTVPVPAALMPIYREAARRVEACTCTADTLAVAQWVYDQLQQQPDQPEQQPEQGDEGQDGQQGDQGQDEGQGGQEAQENAQEGEGQGEGQGEGDEPDDAGEAQRPTHRMHPRETEPTSGRPSGVGGTYQAEAASPGTLPQFGDTWPTTMPIPGRLRYEVRRLFENSAREWRDPGFKSGSIHRGSLYKVGTNRPEIFARRFSEDGIDSAVVLLLDISGSMYAKPDPRIACAVPACVMLLDCLAQAGADTMVVAFGACTHVVKPFGSPWRRAVPTLEHIGVEGDTCDYHALRLSHDHILRHPAQRRVVFAITDGQGDMDRTRAQRMSGEALGIQHLGIGIQEDCSYTWGPQSVTINTPADLGRVAFQQLRRAA